MAALVTVSSAAVSATGLTSIGSGAAANHTESALTLRSVSFSGLRKDHSLCASAASSFAHAANAAATNKRNAPGQKRAAGTRAAAAEPVVASAAYVAPKKILMMGGSRFIGLYLARALVKAGHEVTLFTRGKAPIAQQIPGETDAEFAEYSAKVKHIKGDRKDFDGVRRLLRGSGFQVVYDINGREGAEVEPILDALPRLEQYIFCSSAGVYLKSDVLPHREEDAVDPKSRHKGKLDTEALLQARGAPWTSIRPVYIYGPLNYNPVEEWFFHRLKAGRPVPVPNSGTQVTQLGHVKDLARAFELVLANPLAIGEVFNISGPRYVTFDGIANACAEAMGAPKPTLVHYNPKDFDFGKKKAFPLRDQHFFASNDKAEDLLGWKPQFDLVDGLRDSYQLDFGRGTFRKAADFSVDDMILAKAGVGSSSSSPSSSAAVSAPVAAVAQASGAGFSVQQLQTMPLPRLHALARARGIHPTSRPDLIRRLAASGVAPAAAAGTATAAVAGGAGVGGGSGLSVAELQGKSIGELRALARARGVRGDTKAELVKLLSSGAAAAAPAAAAAAASSAASWSAPAAPAASSNGAGAGASALSEKQLLAKSVGELRALAARRGIRGGNKAELVKALVAASK
ncbi:hypothetical protein CLOM_g14474 [Closterium sp. NIES-68]|nr:hypothetical protein CLOM_g14474 [Closterium sp. NIES-68]GJP81564.1 hypothetical protein CLOP_g11700 [Closterium sp. NIES-67]